MSREIIEAIRTIEREKGIEGDTLITALEDALLAAYKKTPGASRHATVELDRETGDFRVFAIELPADLEERLPSRRPQQRCRRALEGRVTAAMVGVGLRRVMRGGEPDQGRHRRGPLRHEGPAGDPLEMRPGADQDALRARGARDRGRTRRD